MADDDPLNSGGITEITPLTFFRGQECDFKRKNFKK